MYTTRTCPVCHETMEEKFLYEVQPYHRTIGEIVLSAKVVVQKSDPCGCVVYHSTHLEALELAAALWLVDHGVRTPCAVRFLRKTMGLSIFEFTLKLNIDVEIARSYELESAGEYTPAIPLHHYLVLCAALAEYTELCYHEDAFVRYARTQDDPPVGTFDIDDHYFAVRSRPISAIGEYEFEKDVAEFARVYGWDHGPYVLLPERLREWEGKEQVKTWLRSTRSQSVMSPESTTGTPE